MQTLAHEALASIDDQARHLAQEHLSGGITDEAVRHRFAELIFTTQVARDVTRSLRAPSCDWEDIEGAVSETLLLKTYAGAGDGGLDVARIADGASLTGWARQLGKRIASSKRRDQMNANSKSAPFAPTGTPGEPTPFEHVSVAAAGADERLDEEHDQGVLLAFREQIANAVHAATRTRTQARAVRTTFDLPQVVADPNPLTTYLARQAIEANPAAALDSLRNRHTRSCDPLLSPMWDSYSEEDGANVETLVSQWGYQAAVLLIQEAVVAQARPPAIKVRAMTEEIVSWSRSLGWSSATARLVEAYLAVACTPLCAGDRRKPSPELDEVLDTRRATALTWDQVVAEHLVAYPTSPAGTTPEQIAATMDALLEDALEPEPTNQAVNAADLNLA